MPRENNFLLGDGERLTKTVDRVGSGGSKNPPYDFITARNQVTTWLERSVQSFDSLPNQACPRDEVVAVITLHPRYLSKSDFPADLFSEVGIKVVGGRSRLVRPTSWGIDKHPDEAMTDDLFVAGRRQSFRTWVQTLPQWREDTPGALSLTHLEHVAPFSSEDKTKTIPKQGNVLLEVVLYGADKPYITEEFESYVRKLHANPLMDRCRTAGTLTFIPIKTTVATVLDIAKFSYVRVVRAMPTLRPFFPSAIRSLETQQDVTMPDPSVVDQTSRVVIFDGGLPQPSAVDPWGHLIEPQGIGPTDPAFLDHGLGVTSSFLFGSIPPGSQLSRPISKVDHVRVLDTHNPPDDLMYYDVLDRILDHLDKPANAYDFVNVSLGPDIPVTDDEVTRWTAEFDQRFASGTAVVTVAAGNSGEHDAQAGLNRVQPPSDGVNVLAIGASDQQGGAWNRAAYSSMGPGRTPGVIKPDGVSFGGSATQPFYILSSKSPVTAPKVVPTMGTSFAAPLALRSAAAVRAQLGPRCGGLAIRALLIHRADPRGLSRTNVGWGLFEPDYDRLVTCEDNETLVIFQGQLPVGTYLRAPVPLPRGSLTGPIIITATIVISPETDPEFPNVYTRHGVELLYRPHNGKFSRDPNRPPSTYQITGPFFSGTKMFPKSEYLLRKDDLKWEPSLKASRRYQPTSLSSPVFDIYHHTRGQGKAILSPKPIPYALIIGVQAPNMPTFYNDVVRTYTNILIPLRPQTRLRYQQSP